MDFCVASTNKIIPPLHLLCPPKIVLILFCPPQKATFDACTAKTERSNHWEYQTGSNKRNIVFAIFIEMLGYLIHRTPAGVCVETPKEERKQNAESPFRSTICISMVGASHFNGWCIPGRLQTETSGLHREKCMVLICSKWCELLLRA